MINRFVTYAEISPSETGMKLFFQIRADDLKKMHALLGSNHKGELLTRKTLRRENIAKSQWIPRGSMR